MTFEKRDDNNIIIPEMIDAHFSSPFNKYIEEKDIWVLVILENTHNTFMGVNRILTSMS